MKILCTICARSGSKEVKNKNIIKIKNKMLIDYTIEQANKSNIFNKVVISTNSEKIKKMSKKKVDLIINRPASLANDHAAKLPSIRHAFLQSEKLFGEKFDFIVDLDVTSPLREIKDIKNAVSKLKNSKNTNLISVNESRRNPYFNMIEKRKSGISLVKRRKNVFSTRQLSPKTYDLNASIYVWRRSSLLKSNEVIGNMTSIYVMPFYRSIDIDSKFDLSVVKHILKNKKQYEKQ
jgi:CMP-N,N'-diacetyllegionaminic acid synthase|tara:strand:- start:197 stop:901 length:705 start_codon:yes stop_codon:yes gene_type:complete